jgi:hypothetical protein
MSGLAIIISPAKRMLAEADIIPPRGIPAMASRTEEILSALKKLSDGELRRVLALRDASPYVEMYRRMDKSDLYSAAASPAVLAYDGIQYKYMSPGVFTYEESEYIQRRLFIISGFYGALRAYDGILPYRLEMQSKLSVGGARDLYEYWGSSIYECVTAEHDVIVDLASSEYSRAVLPYSRGVRVVRCVFAEQEGDRLIQKGVYVKMARGAMVRYMAESKAESPEALRDFHGLGYSYSPTLSEKDTYVFIASEKKEKG